MLSLYPQKLALASPTSGGPSVGKVRLQTKSHGRFQVSTAVTMNIVVDWDVMPCGSCKNPGTYRLHHQGEENQRVTNNVSNNYELRDAAFLQEPHGVTFQKTKQQTLWPLVRKRTIPTEQRTLVDEI
jgi:hypothetical protein